jgi:hypothetical protein
VTGRATDGDSDWDGPQWAAPERAERLATHPEYGRHDRMFGMLCRALAGGLLKPSSFQDVMGIKLMIEAKERAS